MKKAITTVLILIETFFLFTGAFSKNFTFETENKAVMSIDGIDFLTKTQNIYRNIAKTISPGVVSVNVESEQIIQNPYSLYMNDPFFRRFFGDQIGPKEYKQKLQAMGSGFVISRNGYLFTNYHVVKGAIKIVVVLYDNRKFDAKVVGFDAETDIALLKINDNNLIALPLGDSGEVQVGDIVMAIGNPYGLAETFTSGAVSAIGRPGMTGYQKFIQTDTAVNPGNSGGPLVNIKGQVIGINSAIQSQSGGFQGISFAVPINIAKSIANQLLDQGKVERGYLGLSAAEIDATTRKMLGLQPDSGMMVSKVDKNGPADLAGMKSGDIILMVESQAVNSPDDLQSTIGNLMPGTIVNLQILRNKKTMSVDVKLAERPGETSVGQPAGKDNSSPATYEFMGVTFSNSSKELLDDNGVNFGVLIKGIREDSPLNGVLNVDSIVSAINNNEIRDIAGLKVFAEKYKNARSLYFLIVKNGYMYYRGIER